MYKFIIWNETLYYYYNFPGFVFEEKLKNLQLSHLEYTYNMEL